MLAQILEEELLTDLSEQQQEMIAGGLQGIQRVAGTFYHADMTEFFSQMSSGPNGSYVTTAIKHAQVTTGSIEILNANFFNNLFSSYGFF